ncbi:hypothetical protein F2P45_31290 [Massilia sp. CCM 8733]|uniref:DUF3630 domain-containing protein n=1 Tax=Massilia mucilaginosa TaxID=2609282 RepID=A0ABX0P3R9_9BURK|nr:hypothetical protein [Massilia mucilaginosa]NHZ93455.1 hypothetical protein [Massilia mucilaginosa]
MQDFVIHIMHEESLTPDDDNIDVIVTFADGRRYSASFFTVSNIITLMERWKLTGENAHGLHFSCPDAIIVERLTRDVVTRTVANLLDTGSFFWTLKLLEND